MPPAGLGLAGLQRAEVGGAGTADGAEPVPGDVLELRSGRDAAVGIADRGVVDEAAALADPESRFRGRGHTGSLEGSVFEADRDRLAVRGVFDLEVLARGEAALVGDDRAGE